MSAVRRDISPFLQRIRAFLLGRERSNALRFEDGLADRTQPPPNIPDGPSHLLSANYYYMRDVRREVQPPVNLMQQRLLQAKSADAGKAVAATRSLPTPGQIYRWD